ncbi:MAG: family 10 glycosylhydrolase [Clostridia bacterium]|nr:family 10 glycosylhydrolase [Clostridia bacterium]
MNFFTISNFNGARGADELVIYNKSGKTGTNSYGYEACILDGRVISCGKNNNEIPEDGYVVSGHGAAMEFLANNVIVGARAEITADGRFGIEIDDCALEIDAGSKIYNIERRMIALEIEDIPYDKEKATTLLDEAKKALEAKDYATVKSLCEEAYYYTARSVKGEVRAVWHRPHEKSDEAVEATVNKLADAGFNLILVETNYEGYANAQKCVHDFLPIRKGYENGFDVIDSFIRACKKRGVKIHCWFEDFFFGVQGHGCPMAEKRPELMAKRKDGGILHDAFDNFYFLNPALPEVQDLLLSLIKEILDNYDFDGFQLDYIRYPVIHGVDRSAGFEPETKAEFIADTGIDIDTIQSTDCAEWKKFLDWRAAKVTKYVESVRNLILEYRARGRNIELSTAVFGDPVEAINLKCQNWQYWVKQGWLDAIYPMAYLNDAEDVGNEVAYMVEHYGEAPNISGISPMYNKLPVIESTKQVEECRKAGAIGVAFFCAGNCTEEQLEKLKIGVFRD